MGTRHMVKVIKNGELIISKYGQWDGYAGTAGVAIKNFIKENGKTGLEDCVKFITPVSDNETDAFQAEESLFGYRHSEETMQKIRDALDIYKEGYRDAGGDTAEVYGKSVRTLLYHFEFPDVSRYYMLTRDTGYSLFDVLQQLSEYNPRKLPIISYVDKDSNPGREYTIDLDNDRFTVKIFENEKSWSFDNLPEDKELEKMDE